MQIVLIRHAQPDWEPDGLAVDEPGLTELGVRQAHCAADELSSQPFDAFYASPMKRVVETVEPIRAKLGLQPTTVSWLREMGLPSLQGQTSEEVQEFLKGAHARALEDWWDGMPGGESFRHFYERVTSGLEGLLQGDHRLTIHQDSGHRLWQLPESSERILIAAHEVTNSAIISHLLGIEPVPWTWLRFSSSWAGISTLHTMEVGGGHVWGLECFNYTAHMNDLHDEMSDDDSAS